ncbi:hypothetical protein [Pseudomonas syringae]|uniref:hypothetical protein n=1 Tax=Pseudomonas syringae TaxID=317 RepID=UPI001124DDCD|nr:hypothetical protein [Pseudomonas syringae]
MNIEGWDGDGALRIPDEVLFFVGSGGQVVKSHCPTFAARFQCPQLPPILTGSYLPKAAFEFC